MMNWRVFNGWNTFEGGLVHVDVRAADEAFAMDLARPIFRYMSEISGRPIDAPPNPNFYSNLAAFQVSEQENP